MSAQIARPEPAPLQGSALALTSVALALGTFMQVLDTTIANVSLPTIAGDLGASTDQGTWVITSFAVANGVTLPLTGWVMRRYGAVRTFSISVLLFTLASFLCGIAWSLPSLVLFRILQGAVSGPMIPGSQSLLISIFPAARRGTALAIWSMTTLVAPICGPLLGGYISDNMHWSWIFFINVPIGLLCGIVSWRALATRETPTQKLPIDLTGLGLLIVWVGALQIMLDTGKNADWFESTQIVVLAVIAAVGCAVWIVWEVTEKHPIVDLSLFKRRNFALGVIVSCLAYAVFFGNVIILPLWLQTQIGYTATWAGLVAAPSGMVAVFLTPLAARMMSRIDGRWAATFSLLAFATSYFLRSRYTTDASFVDFAIPMLVQGVAMSMFFISTLTITLNGLHHERIPSASGLYNFIRIITGSFAASITTTVWDRREALHQSRLADGTSLYDPAMRQMLAALHGMGIPDAQALAILTRSLTSQAYMLASDDYFWMSGWLILAMIGVVWCARRSMSGGGPVAASD
ncbi:MAG TPA: DHA2 family efflux MFS transporter permease subunit [Parvibaculum sp.]